jgi:hypothetical protein
VPPHCAEYPPSIEKVPAHRTVAEATAARRRAPAYWPETVAIATVFIGSRGVAWALGVRFDTSSLSWFWQYIDPGLLKTRLLESLFYFHAQPPLYNLWLGVLLKLFGGRFSDAAHGTYVLLGLAGTGGLAFLLARIGVPRILAVVLALAFFLSPSAILYENWLFYEYPVAVLLIFAVLTLYLFLQRRSFAYGVAFFGILASIVYIRSTFQIVWLLLGLGLVLVVAPDLRRMTLRACAVPLILVVLLYAKNAIIFGTFSTSSWFGMNLAQVVLYSAPSADRAQLVAEGRISRVSLVEPFSPLTAYRGIVPPARKRGIQVLDERLKSTGETNFNNSSFLTISNHYLHDALHLIAARPHYYFASIRLGLERYFSSSSQNIFVRKNRSKIQPYERLFNRFIYVRSSFGGGVCWGIVAGYTLAIGYGLFLLVRLIRRRRPTAPREGALLFAWMTVVYLAVVETVSQVTENQRIRFLSDGLVVVLLAALVRDARDRLATRNRLTDGVPERVTDRVGS